jgi:hypothetical protein
MRRLIAAAALVTFALSYAFGSSALADEKSEAKECKYKECSTPWQSGGGLKTPPVAGEKQKGWPTSICQTPINWCIIGPAPVGASCYCWTPIGTAAWGITVQ